MLLDSIRETFVTLRESRAAIHDGRIALAEANTELRARYDRSLRRIDRVDRALELLRADGPDTDLRDLFDVLDGDSAAFESATDDSARAEISTTAAMKRR